MNSILSRFSKGDPLAHTDVGEDLDSEVYRGKENLGASIPSFAVPSSDVSGE